MSVTQTQQCEMSVTQTNPLTLKQVSHRVKSLS